MTNSNKISRLFVIFLISLISFLSACSGKSESDKGPEASLVKELGEGNVKDGEFRSEQEEKYYQDGIKAFDEELYTIAAKNLGMLRSAFPGSRYYEDSVAKIADARFLSGKYEESIAGYQEYLSLYPKGGQVEWSSLQIGRAWFEQFKGVARNQAPLDSAASAYQKFLKTYPESEFKEEAQEEFQRIVVQKSESEAEVIKFYLKKDNLPAAAGRYADLKANFPDSPALDEIESLIEVEYPNIKSEFEELAAVSPLNKDTRFALVEEPATSPISRAQLKPFPSNEASQVP